MKRNSIISIIFFFSFLFVNSPSIYSQVGVGITSPGYTLQVHDSAAVSNIMISSGLTTDNGLNLKAVASGNGYISSKGDLYLNSNQDGIPGSQGKIKIFKTGNVGIGPTINNTETTNTLTISGTNPLKLIGTIENNDIDTILMLSDDGIVHKRGFDDLMGTYWIRDTTLKSIYNLNERIGIGGADIDGHFGIRKDSFIQTLYEAESIVRQKTITDDVILIEETYSGSFFEDEYGIPDANGLSVYGIGSNNALKDTVDLLFFNDSKGYIKWNTDEGERMRLKGNGNFIVGKYDEKLNDLMNVNGDLFVADTIFLKDKSNSISVHSDDVILKGANDIELLAGSTKKLKVTNVDSTWVTFDNENYSVGINETNPNHELHVNGDSYVMGKTYIGTTTNKIFASGDNLKLQSEANIKFQTNEYYDITFNRMGTEYARFDANKGRLGIGTSTPTTTLDVIGTIKTDTFQLNTLPSDGYVLTSNSTGIGTWQELPVDNDWTIVGSDLHTSTSGNVLIGSTGAATSKLTVTGSFSLPITTTSSTSYSPNDSEYTIILDSPSTTINLPSAMDFEGRIYVLKFMSSGGVILGSGADEVNGTPGSYIVPASPYGSTITTVVVQSDGMMGWWVINY